MHHDVLKNHFQKITPLSNKEAETISNYFKTIFIKKGDYILQQGNICKFEGFVIDGCFRIFSIDKNGNEKNLYFAVKDWWLMDIDSFMNATPSDLNIEALEDSKILLITKKDKDFLYKNSPFCEKLFRIMSQRALVAWQKRLIRNHCLTAKERFFHFKATYPHIASKLSDRHIAKYLGISHEFLSKIKK